MEKIDMRKLLVIAVFFTLAGCSNDAAVVTQNIKQDAENFRVARRVVFYNGITNDYILEVAGYCNIDVEPNKLAVVCKAPDGYKRHLLGISDNVTWFSEQLAPNQVSASFYKVTFKPSVIVPAVELR
jgi:hypothetical protein